MRGRRCGKGFFWIWVLLALQVAVEARAIPDNIVPLGQLRVNLAGGNVRDLKTLKVTVVLELGKPEYASDVRERLGEIQGEIILFLSGKSLKQINTRIKQTRLRKEIMDHLNAFLKKEALKNIFFTEFIIR